MDDPTRKGMQVLINLVFILFNVSLCLSSLFSSDSHSKLRYSFFVKRNYIEDQL